MSKTWPDVAHVLSTRETVERTKAKPAALSMPLTPKQARAKRRAAERARRKKLRAEMQDEQLAQGVVKTSKKKKRSASAKPHAFDLDRWCKLRARVLRKYGRKCMRCASVAEPIHVDHIRPRSKFPHLAFDINNLQVLCRPCNEEKSDKFIVDYRPDRPIASRTRPESNAKARKLEAETFLNLQSIVIEFDAAWSAALR